MHFLIENARGRKAQSVDTLSSSAMCLEKDIITKGVFELTHLVILGLGLVCCLNGRFSRLALPT